VGADLAQAAKRRAGVSVDGPHASAMHAVVVGVLKHHGLEATTVDLPSDSQAAVEAAAQKGSLAAIVVGQVRDGGKRFKLRVYDSGGDLVGESSWVEAGGLRRLESAVERTLWPRVGGSLSRARAPGASAASTNEKAPPQEKEHAEEAAAEPTKAPTASRSREPEPPGEAEAPAPKRKKGRAVDEAEEPSGPAATALDLGVGLRFVWRDLSWSPVATTLRGYTLDRAPAVGVSLAWYPLAHFLGGWASNIGIAASVEYAPDLTSQTSDGARYPTTSRDWWAGARGRVVFGVAQASLTLAGGQQAFVFQGQGAALRSNLADLPDVAYTYARAGADLRLELPQGVTLMLGGGFRDVFDAGDTNFLLQANAYLPDSKIVGFDGTVAVGYRFLGAFEARLGVDLRRYQITAGTNTYMATGAIDQYLSGWAQLALLVDGYAAAGGPAPPSKRDDEDSADDKTGAGE
jgi:hypothetical protein